MALSIASGVVFATLITLVLLPGMVIIFNDIQCLMQKPKTNKHSERENLQWQKSLS